MVERARRSFLAYFSGAGLTTTFLPGVLWGKLQEADEVRVTAAMIHEAGRVAGLEFSDEEVELMLEGVNANLERYDTMRETPLDNSVPSPVLRPACSLDGGRSHGAAVSRG